MKYFCFLLCIIGFNCNINAHKIEKKLKAIGYLKASLDYNIPNFHLDPEELSFLVVKHYKSGYKVLLNEETLQTAVIKNDSNHQLVKIEDNQLKCFFYNFSPYNIEENKGWFAYISFKNYYKRQKDVEILTVQNKPKFHKFLFFGKQNVNFIDGKITSSVYKWVKIVDKNDKSKYFWVSRKKMKKYGILLNPCTIE